MNKPFLAIVAAIAFASAVPARAADLPVYKAPPTAVTASYDGWYVWADSSYQDIRLPGYSLGFATGTEIPFGAGTACCGTNLGFSENFSPRATGFGVAGAIGRILPPGTFFGTNARLEFGGSYVNATGTQTGTSGPSAFLLPNSGELQLLNGTPVLNFGCGAGSALAACTERSSLGSNYLAWQLSGKAATDFKNGQFTLTPSAAVFGGAARNNQSLSQLLTANLVIGSTESVAYVANTNLRWTDWGARAGLDAKIDVTNWVAAGVGGWVGVADRTANLTGNDTSDFMPVAFPPIIRMSSISSSATTAALLANAEANLTIRPTAAVTLRGFVGLNYDSRVPGITAPTFTPLFGSTAPAGISFQAETSYYAGGGVTVKFAP
jgi:hypothetical protein